MNHNCKNSYSLYYLSQLKGSLEKTLVLDHLVYLFYKVVFQFLLQFDLTNQLIIDPSVILVVNDWCLSVIWLCSFYRLFYLFPNWRYRLFWNCDSGACFVQSFVELGLFVQFIETLFVLLDFARQFFANNSWVCSFTVNGWSWILGVVLSRVFRFEGLRGDRSAIVI